MTENTCADCGDLTCPLALARGNHIVRACRSFLPRQAERLPTHTVPKLDALPAAHATIAKAKP